MTEASSFLMAMPELVLTAAGLILLMVAAYAGDRATHAVSWLSVLALGAAGITLLLPTTHGTAFDGLYQADAFAAFAKLLIDRKSVVSGKRVSVRVDLGCPRIIKKKKKK